MSQNTPDTTSKSALLAWIKDPARRPAQLTAATGFFPEADRAIAARVDCPPDLQAAGRMVGVISHVPELKQQIGVQIVVTPSTVGSRVSLIRP